jgi:hypothetical protein
LPRNCEGKELQDSGFRIQDSGFRIQDSGFRIQDSGMVGAETKMQGLNRERRIDRTEGTEDTEEMKRGIHWAY